ncbi:low choriolytic enzyme-like [Alosa sapidissima]|uniref:low choriolytic enzyme-like n=1 Tax=Alosa sapidissima TaxID=34773 RepID=UPI001C0A1790|nr:low choriolytic enzyme-like [Alosa sapidissima]
MVYNHISPMYSLEKVSVMAVFKFAVGVLALLLVSSPWAEEVEKKRTVQHELLHALGFNHEQTRSDRDKNIRVMWEQGSEPELGHYIVLCQTLNLSRLSGSGFSRLDKKHNFRSITTLNQNTPYDYNSVMQYSRYAFSKNKKATMVPIPNSNVDLGKTTQMSQNDLLRLNSTCTFIS